MAHYLFPWLSPLFSVLIISSLSNIWSYKFVLIRMLSLWLMSVAHDIITMWLMAVVVKFVTWIQFLFFRFPYTVNMITGLKLHWQEKQRILLTCTSPLAGYMFIGAKKRDTGFMNKKKAKEIGIKKHKAVVDEVPSSPPAPPPTTTTSSETWDLWRCSFLSLKTSNTNFYGGCWSVKES